MKKVPPTQLSNLVPLLAIAMRFASEPTANLSYLVLALYSLFGRSPAIRALFLSWFFTIANSEIAPRASGASLSRYVVILAAAVSMMLRDATRRSSKSLSRQDVAGLKSITLALGTVLVIHSLLFSPILDVSLLKLGAWVTVVVTLLSAWEGLEAPERAAMSDQLRSWLAALLVLSLPLLAVPRIGYAVNGHGFQGLLNHSQSFGPTAALAAALLGGDILAAPLPRWRDLALIGLCMVLMVLSQARTAGIAWALGMLVLVTASPAFAGKSWRTMLPALLSPRLMVVLFAAFVVAGLAGASFTNSLTEYIFKRGETGTLFDAAERSRGELVYRMVDNIQEQPLTGIGFGIGSSPQLMIVQRDPWFGIPVGAPVEKGVMPLAVLEELGVFGALPVVAWILIILRRGARAGAPQFSVLVTLLLVNFGENMFFSVGGTGLLLMILLTSAVTGTGTGQKSSRNNVRADRGQSLDTALRPALPATYIAAVETPPAAPRGSS